MKKSEELLLQIYQEFYRQKSVLTGAPALTLIEENQTAEKIDFQKAKAETEAVVAYLLGLKNISEKNWDELFALINQHYGQQPEWKKILLDYLEYQLEVESENNKKQQENLLNEIQKLVDTFKK